MNNTGVGMLVLVVFWLGWTWYRRSTRCGYCGGEFRKHMPGCPYWGSDSRMPDSGPTLRRRW